MLISIRHDLCDKNYIRVHRLICRKGQNGQGVRYKEYGFSRNIDMFIAMERNEIKIQGCAVLCVSGRTKK